MSGRLGPSLLDHLPKSRVRHHDDFIGVVALDADIDSSRFAVVRDDDPLALGIVEAFAELCFRLANADELHRISFVVLPAGFWRTALTVTSFAPSSTS